MFSDEELGRAMSEAQQRDGIKALWDEVWRLGAAVAQHAAEIQALRVAIASPATIELTMLPEGAVRGFDDANPPPQSPA